MGMRRAAWLGSLVLVSCLAVSGCTANTPDGTAPEETVGCPPSPTGDTDVVTPEELCVRDGRRWQESNYTFIVNTPEWTSSPECDAARKDAWWGAWSHVQENIETIDLGVAAEPERLEASIGIAIIDDRADGVADDPLAALDAEVAACSASDPTWTAVSHEGWNGVSGTSQQDGDTVRSTWWTDAGDRWVVVQTYVANGVTAAETQDAEDAVLTVLDAQAAALGA
ncbi:hypothetical protein NY547_04210 [Cnuibacter physcomitrellae]|uniref:hypothetical protein n=1 Tax=Cnuibacter physcomitrellae TaxID=1619308 RepID=UPI002175AF29|nr:hypothetical protein [Cnuibacter physcomitrellae]MCS5496440.1 hypothetical protein [Cnuibacter physcomitrellae]